jgi:hypothetical protein
MRAKHLYKAAFLSLIALVMLSAPAFAHPGSGIVVDGQGDVYFMDTGHGVWKIGQDGKWASHTRASGHYLTIDRNGKFVQKHFAALEKGDVAVPGASPNLLVGTSYPITVGSDGAFYYPNVLSKGRVRIMRMAPGEDATQFAVLPVAKEVTSEGKEIEAEWVWGLAAGPNGSLYYTEKMAVRRIAPDGTVSTIAENVTVPDCELPPAVESPRVCPGLYGLDIATDGTVYVAASACSALLKIAPDGTVSAALRATDRWSPQGVAVAGDSLYVLEYDYVKSTRREDWLPRVRKIAPDGVVTIIAQIKNREEPAARERSHVPINLNDVFSKPPMTHAAIVHFPIVLFFLCIPAAGLALAFRKRYAWRVQTLILFIVLVGLCIVAEQTGERAESHVPAGPNGVQPGVWDQVIQHAIHAERLKFFAAWGAMLSIVSLVPLKFLRENLRNYVQLGVTALALCIAIGGSVNVIYAAHYGGDLVYRQGIGSDFLRTYLMEKSEANAGKIQPPPA